MQALPEVEEPKIKEARVAKADAFDPTVIAEAYERFLNGDSFDALAIELSIPKKVLAYHARKGDWLTRRADLLGVMQTEADQRYLDFLARERLPAAERHLRVAGKLEGAIERIVDKLIDIADEDGDITIDDKRIRRLTESMASISAVSARAAGITDRPAPVGGGNQSVGKQPLIIIGVQPTVDKGEKQGVTIDVSDYVEEK
jgi:hypothetical protein